MLEQVLEKYPRDVKLVFKNYPLRNHPFAQPAAMAALAADKQGKFWEFHDLLFKNYKRPDAQKVEQIARQLGLDMIRFEKDQKDPQIKALIRQDMLDASRAGVRGTPAVYINGRLLRNRSLPGFRDLIDKELKKRR